jgi:hypothetical protein
MVAARRGGHLMQISDHTEHRKLDDGQLVTDAAGRLWRVTKYRPVVAGVRQEPPTETWLEHWSDEYAVSMSDDKIVCIGDEPLFPLTVVQVVPVPTDAAEQRPVPVFEENGQTYRFRCPCGTVFEGPAGEVGPVSTDAGRVALWMGQGGAGELIAIHLQGCEQGRAVAYVEFV